MTKPKPTSKRPRYVVRPCDDPDTDDPRTNWDVADTHERDDAGFPISMATYRTRNLAREAAHQSNEQAAHSLPYAGS